MKTMHGDDYDGGSPCAGGKICCWCRVILKDKSERAKRVMESAEDGLRGMSDREKRSVGSTGVREPEESGISQNCLYQHHLTCLRKRWGERERRSRRKMGEIGSHVRESFKGIPGSR